MLKQIFTSTNQDTLRLLIERIRNVNMFQRAANDTLMYIYSLSKEIFTRRK